MQSTAMAATYYVGTSATGDGLGRDRNNLKTISAASHSALPGDHFLLQAGNYGDVTIDSGFGTQAGGWVTYRADPHTTTGRAANWYEQGLARPNPSNPGNHVIFTRLQIGPYKSGVTSIGHYIEVVGIDIVDVGVPEVGVYFSDYVAHLRLTDCCIFGVVPSDLSYHHTADRTTACVYFPNHDASDFHDITIDSCYAELAASGFWLFGVLRDNIIVRRCHIRDVCASTIRIGDRTSGDGTVLIDGCHIEIQNGRAEYSRGDRTVAASDKDAPRRIFAYTGEPVTGGAAAYWVDVTDVSTGATALRRIAAHDLDTKRVTLDADAPFDIEAGDALTFWHNSHGSGVAIFSPHVTVKNCRIHNTGASGAIFNYVTGNAHVTLENNLVYNSKNQYGVEFASYPMGDYFTVVNNTFIGRRHPNYGLGSENYYYGFPFQYAAAPGTNNATVTICNNIFVGSVSGAGPGALVRNNIVYDGPSYEEDAAGENQGNVVYFDRASHLRKPAHPKPFDGSGRFFVGGGGFDDYAWGDSNQEYRSTDRNLNNAFRLAQGSAAIDSAHAPEATSTDIEGNMRDGSPDIGCYEYGGSGSTKDGPTLAPVGDKDATAGTLLRFDVTASDPNGDTLTYSATGLPQGATFSGQTFTWTLTADQVGIYQVTFTVSDGRSQDSVTITITVAMPNSPPELAAISGKSVSENSLLTFTVSATDADTQDTLTYSATGLPNGAAFSGQTFTWKPGYTQAGSYQVTFVVSDGRDQDSEVVMIDVANVNRTPALNSISDRSVDTDNTLQFSLAATDPDGDSLTYSASGLPTGANLSGRNFTWAPTADQIGSYDVTFTVSDGRLSDSKTATLVVVAAKPDTTAPVVARCSPEPDSIQVSVNNLLTLHVTDAGKGVDAGSVVIRVNDQIVYQGNETVYTSPSGRCSRSGSKNDYRYVYQADQMDQYDETMVVKVNAADLQGNIMSEYSYSYVTEMQSFGINRQVSRGTRSADAGRPVTARDSAGNLWVAWHAGAQGSRDVYVAKLAPGAGSFLTPVQLTNDAGDQCNPDLAAGSDGKVYVVWQDNRRGNWDIFAAVSSNHRNFSKEIRVSDSNDNETNPAAAVDSQSPNCVYVAWQDDRNSHQDIYVAGSVNAFVSTSLARVTKSGADQTDPDLTVDGQNVVYVVWTDLRNKQPDIYAAASDAGPWTNVPVVTTASEQTDPTVAAEPGGTTLHLLWVDNAHGDQDIYYASLAGLSGTPVTGRSIADDTSGADQSSPTIACAQPSRTFACWQDARHAGARRVDTDLYFAELRAGVAKTNILVGDDNTNAGQSEPVVGVNTYGHPYVVWLDDRSQPTQVYYAAGTFIDPDPLDSKLVTAAGATIGTAPTAINQVEDVSIVVPPGACQTDVLVTISRVINPQVYAVECLGSYDFGPSGVDFNQPVTVTVPYHYSGDGESHALNPGNGESHALPYWYDALTGALSQQGITDIENIVVSSNLNALRFRTTHFTAFYIIASDSESDSSIGAAGGCSISRTGNSSPKELLVPYVAIATIIVILRRRDKRRQELLEGIRIKE